MKKLTFAIIVMAIVMLTFSATAKTYASTSWTTVPNSGYSHPTGNNPGNVKICGDHKCAPFEYEKMQKSIQGVDIKKLAQTPKQQGFEKEIQYLIQQGIMKIPSIQSSTGNVTIQQIPSWVMTIVSFWHNGELTDDEFVKGIQYLLDYGIIKI